MDICIISEYLLPTSYELLREKVARRWRMLVLCARRLHCHIPLFRAHLLSQMIITDIESDASDTVH